MILKTPTDIYRASKQAKWPSVVAAITSKPFDNTPAEDRATFGASARGSSIRASVRVTPKTQRHCIARPAKYAAQATHA